MFKKIAKIFPLFCLLMLVLIVFKAWFKMDIISSGDWNFRFDEQVRSFTIFPYVWSYLSGNIGANVSFLLGLNAYFLGTASILSNYFHIPWLLIERLVWFWPYLAISIFSSYFLFKELFSNKFALLSPFIFIFSTYNLMVVGGGQMGVAMSYAILPLILAFFIRLINSQKFVLKTSLITGIITAIQLAFDPRILYVTMVIVFIYFMVSEFRVSNIKIFINKFLIVFIPVGVIAILLNAFWLFPFLMYRQNPLQQLGAIYSTAGAVGYFSFARFEQAISLLHPYWPENIFGKVYFMRPEFLLFPLLAFSSLFFLKKEEKNKRKMVLFFALLAIIGAFLAKGSNDLFGGIYLWLFSYFPGFIMFRDPTKWYMLVGISYSILIPFTVWRTYEWLKLKNKSLVKSKVFNLQNIFLLFVICSLVFIIKPAWTGQLNGTLKPYSMPNDYIVLKDFLVKDKDFYRTFWVPAYEKFGFWSDTHSIISGKDFISRYNPYEVVDFLKNAESQKILQELSVKYVIVPFDFQGEIFLKDRKYDEVQYLKTIEHLKQIPWLKEIKGFGKINVFEISNPREHFWSPNQNIIVDYKYINPTRYEIGIQNVKKGDILVFSETFDSGWMIKDNSSKNYNSKQYNKLFNSFVLNKDGNYSLEAYYEPQKWVIPGLWISGVTLLIVMGFISLGFVNKKW
jgi:hypothetical protein